MKYDLQTILQLINEVENEITDSGSGVYITKEGKGIYCDVNDIYDWFNEYKLVLLHRCKLK